MAFSWEERQDTICYKLLASVRNPEKMLKILSPVCFVLPASHILIVNRPVLLSMFGLMIRLTA